MASYYFLYKILCFVLSSPLLAPTMTLPLSKFNTNYKIEFHGHQGKGTGQTILQKNIVGVLAVSPVQQKYHYSNNQHSKRHLKTVGLNYGWYSRPLYRRRPNSKFRKLDSVEIGGGTPKNHNHVHTFWRDIDMDNSSLNGDFNEFMKTVANNRKTRDVSAFADVDLKRTGNATSYFDSEHNSQNLKTNFSHVQTSYKNLNRTKLRPVFYLKIPTAVHRKARNEETTKFPNSLVTETSTSSKSEDISKQKVLFNERRFLALSPFDTPLNETINNKLLQGIELKNAFESEIEKKKHYLKPNINKPYSSKFRIENSSKYKNVTGINWKSNGTQIRRDDQLKMLTQMTTTSSGMNIDSTIQPPSSSGPTPSISGNEYKAQNFPEYEKTPNKTKSHNENRSKNIRERVYHTAHNSAAAHSTFKPLNVSLPTMKTRIDQLLKSKKIVRHASAAPNAMNRSSSRYTTESVIRPHQSSQEVPLLNSTWNNFNQPKVRTSNVSTSSEMCEKFGIIFHNSRDKCNMNRNILKGTIRRPRPNGFSQRSTVFHPIIHGKRPIRPKLRREFTFADIINKVDRDFKLIHDKRTVENKIIGEEETKKGNFSTHLRRDYHSTKTLNNGEAFPFSRASGFLSNARPGRITTINRIGKTESKQPSNHGIKHENLYASPQHKCTCTGRGLLGTMEGFQTLVAVGEMFSRKFLFLRSGSHTFPSGQKKREQVTVHNQSRLNSTPPQSKQNNQNFNISTRIKISKSNSTTGEQNTAYKNMKEVYISSSIKLDKDTLKFKASPLSSMSKGIMMSQDASLKLPNVVQKPSLVVENGNTADGLVISAGKNLSSADTDTTIANTSAKPLLSSAVLKVATRRSNGKTLRSNSATSRARTAQAASLQMQLDPLLEPESRHPQRNGKFYARVAPGKNVRIKQPEWNANSEIMRKIRIAESPLAHRFGYSSNYSNDEMNLKGTLREFIAKFVIENLQLLSATKKEDTDTIDLYLSMLSSPTENFSLSPEKALYFRQLNEKMKTALYVFEFWLLSSLGEPENIAIFNDVWYSLGGRSDRQAMTKEDQRSFVEQYDASDECDCSASTLGTIAGFSTLTTLLGYSLSVTTTPAL